MKPKNPARDEVLTTIPRGTNEDVDLAVQAANRTFDTWYWNYEYTERAERLHEFAELVEAHSEHLGALDAANSGNPFSKMQHDAR